MTAYGAAGAVGAHSAQRSAQAGHNRRVLRVTRGQLKKSALKFLGYVAAVYLLLKLIPGLEQALSSLEHVHWQWVVAALALETLSEVGFVTTWGAIVDPERLLGRDGRGKRMDERVAWAQLGGGTLVPGGSLGGVGVGAWMLHRFGMPNRLIAERQFNLSFLNTAVDALTLVVFGLALASGILSGSRNLNLTLLPAALAASAVAAALLVAHRAGGAAQRTQVRHHRIASAATTLAEAVGDTERLLLQRGSSKALLGAIAYLGFDVLVLWSAFIASRAHPLPGLPVVVMAYIIGALGGSLPLPAGIGSIGGMVGMLILYGVAHDTAFAAVLLYQAVGMLVPLVGGAIAYFFVRRKLGPIHPEREDHPEREEVAGADEPYVDERAT